MTTSASLSWPVDGAAPTAVPSTLAIAGRLVGHDLLASPHVRNSMASINWWLDSDELLPAAFVLFGLAEDRDRVVGFGIDPTDPVSAVVTTVADRVQQHLTGYAFLQWPRCADGRHVMRPAESDGQAMWICDHGTGDPILIGAWTPSGDPDPASGDAPGP